MRHSDPKATQREWLDETNSEQEPTTPQEVLEEAGVCPNCWEPITSDGCLCTLECGLCGSLRTIDGMCQDCFEEKIKAELGVDYVTLG